VSLRRHDIRELQQDLGRFALSSLGRLESHVMATLDALLALLTVLDFKNDPRVRCPKPVELSDQSLSFVRRPEDVGELLGRVKRRFRGKELKC
jgi:hypothetical protein